MDESTNEWGDAPLIEVILPQCELASVDFESEQLEFLFTQQEFTAGYSVRLVVTDSYDWRSSADKEWQRVIHRGLCPVDAATLNGKVTKAELDRDRTLTISFECGSSLRFPHCGEVEGARFGEMGFSNPFWSVQVGRG